MALSGVRSSWLMVARKRDFARFASSARRRASSEFAFACSSSAKMASFSARDWSVATALRIEAVGEEDEEELRAPGHRHEHDGVHVGGREREREDRKRDRHEPGVDRGRDRRRQHRDQGREHDQDEQQKAARTRRRDRDQHLDDKRPARPLEDLAEDEPAPPGLERDAVRILAQEALRQRQHQRHRGGDEDEPQERVLKRDPDRRDGADGGREPEQRHRGARPVLGEKPDELVVERPLEADRRGQALADVADVLREAAPARAVIRRRSADPADHLRRRLTHHATRNPPGRRQPTPRQSHHGGDWLTILFRRSGSPPGAGRISMCASAHPARAHRRTKAMFPPDPRDPWRGESRAFFSTRDPPCNRRALGAALKA